MKEDEIMVMMREFPETFLKRKVLHYIILMYLRVGGRCRGRGVSLVMVKDNERG